MEKLITRRSTYDSGAASEFLVLSLLYRMGIDAFISLGNKKSIDIVIKAKNGLSLTVDVKAVRGYSSIVVNNVRSSDNHFIVALAYNNKFDDPTTLPDFYIIPSKEIKKLSENYKGEMRLLKGKLAAYQNRWNYLSN